MKKKKFSLPQILFLTRLAIVSLALGVSCLLFSGCTKKDPHGNVKKTSMNMKEFEEDVVIPKALWKEMERVFKPLALDAEGKAIEEEAKGGHGSEPDKSKDDELLKKKLPTDPVAITVELVEKTSGVLGGQNYELKYPLGGGLLDYRQFVPETHDGTFYLYVKYGAEMDKKDTHIYYLSNAKVRDVDGKPMGNGCDRYLDITSYWNGEMKGKGLELNTAKLRHISVTAGTIYFVSPYKGKLRLAHLTLRDTRHRDLMCSSDIKE